MDNFNDKQKGSDPYYEGIPEMDPIPIKKNSGFYFDLFGSMSIEAVYVIDFRERQFRYVSNHSLFLCGHSQDEVLNLSYDFYTGIVHPEDLPLWEKMHNAILKYSLDPEEQPEDIEYFSFTIRIKNVSKIPNRQKYLMVYQKLKPVFQNGQIYQGICMLNISAISTPGNLEVLHKTGMESKKYSFVSQKWKVQHIEPLTECEKMIIKLASMGLNEKEIADKLCQSTGTIRNKCSALFRKLNVDDMKQAINVVNNSNNKCP
jgi:DNA-binding CsgD family transcriptional regulator